MGGTIVDKSNYPFLVSLQKNGMHYCAGTIISSYHILTAAHCCFKGDELTTPIDIDDTAVVLGETNLSQCQDQIQKLTNVRCENIEIDKIVVHPEYSPFKMINDLAIIYTKTPMLNLSIMISDFNQSFSNSSRLMIAGWGFTNEFDTINNDRILHETPTYVTNISECASLGLELNEPRNQWCIGRGDGHSSCQGDSGGPLIQQELEESYSKTSLIGVTSFGPTNSCGKVWKRSVFTIVYNYKDWILEHSRIQRDKLASHSPKLQINSALLILLIILKLFGMLFITI